MTILSSPSCSITPALKSLKASSAIRMFQETFHAAAPKSPRTSISSIDSGPGTESQSICQETTEGKQEPTAPADDLLSVLPCEVISNIFYYACEPIQGNRKWQRGCYPLHLGQLSRRYRQYAWAASELWTTVVIRLVAQKVAAQTELLEEWLARAMGRPLDIFFETDAPRTGYGPLTRLTKPGSSDAAIAPMINLLTRYSLQWRSIDFFMPAAWYPTFSPMIDADGDYIMVADNGEDYEPASTPAPLHLPLLISASLHRDDQVALAQQAVSLDLTLAPSLRSLSLSFFRMSPVIFEGGKFKHITSLTLDTVYDINPHVLFPQLPNLEEAIFRRASFSRARSNRKTRHKKLRRLEVGTDNAIQLQYFLPIVNLPRLESLSVCVETAMRYSNVFVVPYWEADLTSLSLTCKIGTEYDLIEVLSDLGTLRELYVRDSNPKATQEAGLGSTFFDVLNPDEDSTYLPRLEVFSYTGNLAVQAIDFLEPLIIRSRVRGGSSGTYLGGIAVLRKAKIQADQISALAEFSIAEYSDPQYIWEIMRMMEEGILELITMDGEFWQ